MKKLRHPILAAGAFHNNIMSYEPVICGRILTAYEDWERLRPDEPRDDEGRSPDRNGMDEVHAEDHEGPMDKGPAVSFSGLEGDCAEGATLGVSWVEDPSPAAGADVHLPAGWTDDLGPCRFHGPGVEMTHSGPKHAITRK